MPDRIAIYDSELELGAIIDTDEMKALGPVGGGPNARAELTQFIERMPEAIWALSTYDLAIAYLQFWDAEFRRLYESPNEGDGGSVVEPDGRGDNAARLAEHEARAGAGEPPSPAPHDTDVEADAGAAATVTGEDAAGAGQSDANGDEPPPYEGPCFACGGSGLVPTGNPTRQAQCNLCKGTGELPAPVQS